MALSAAQSGFFTKPELWRSGFCICILLQLLYGESLLYRYGAPFLLSIDQPGEQPFDTAALSQLSANGGYNDYFHGTRRDNGNLIQEQIAETYEASLRYTQLTKTRGWYLQLGSNGSYVRSIDNNQDFNVRAAQEVSNGRIVLYGQNDYVYGSVCAGYNNGATLNDSDGNSVLLLRDPVRAIDRNPLFEYRVTVAGRYGWLQSSLQSSLIGSISTGRVLRSAMVPMVIIPSSGHFRTFPLAFTQSDSRLRLSGRLGPLQTSGSITYSAIKSHRLLAAQNAMPLDVNGEALMVHLATEGTFFNRTVLSGGINAFYGTGTVNGYDQGGLEFLRLDSIAASGLTGILRGTIGNRLQVALTGEWLQALCNRGFFKTASFSSWSMFNRVDYLLRNSRLDWWALGPEVNALIPVGRHQTVSLYGGAQRFSVRAAVTTIEKTIVVLIPGYGQPIVNEPVNHRGWLLSLCLADTIRFNAVSIVPSLRQLVPVIDSDNASFGSSDPAATTVKTDWRGGTQYRLSLFLNL